jgi:hypothetical protein
MITLWRGKVYFSSQVWRLQSSLLLGLCEAAHQSRITWQRKLLTSWLRIEQKEERCRDQLPQSPSGPFSRGPKTLHQTPALSISTTSKYCQANQDFYTRPLGDIPDENASNSVARKSSEQIWMDTGRSNI